MIGDEEFLRGEVPMTKQEIRILTLAKARLDFDSVVVDVGTGTGSMMNWGFAHEKDNENILREVKK